MGRLFTAVGTRSYDPYFAVAFVMAAEVLSDAKVAAAAQLADGLAKVRGDAYLQVLRHNMVTFEELLKAAIPPGKEVTVERDVTAVAWITVTAPGRGMVQFIAGTESFALVMGVEDDALVAEVKKVFGEPGKPYAPGEGDPLPLCVGSDVTLTVVDSGNPEEVLPELREALA